MHDRDMTNNNDGAGRDKGGGADRSRSGPGIVKITTFANFFLILASLANLEYQILRIEVYRENWKVGTFFADFVTNN